MREISRTRALVTMAILLALPLFGLRFALADGISFQRTLKTGISGEDVRELQKILNADAQTRISDTGPGSPGQETAYFGGLTQAAVIRFQEKYASTILIPNGLYSGTGIVGPSTRVALNGLEQDKKIGTISSVTPSAQPSTPAALPATSASNSVSSPSASIPVSSNPNFKNLDKFFASIDTVSKKQGISQSSLVALKDQVVKDISTTTNLRDAFIKQVEAAHSSVSAQPSSPMTGALLAISHWFSKTFEPEKALAQSSDQAFGGQIYFSFFCTCSANWLLTIQPLAPTYVALLLYETGTQMYLNYNLPISLYALGKYQQGGQCQIYIGTGCSTLPSEGQISPGTGSSLI